MNEDTEVHKDDFKHLVRIANTDLDGNKRVAMALTGVKGVGRRVANVLAQKSGVGMNEKIGTLPDSDIDKLKQVVEGAFTQSLPTWMLNRRIDILTGESKHVHGSDLAMQYMEDTSSMRKIRCYRGIRHERGHKVRGQRTRSTGRTGATVGVVRKKLAERAER
ncbi:MAG: 30S ribosomal protein S13 [Methermicoccaceae archaeon]